MNRDLGLNLNYQSISMENAFNLPTISLPVQQNIKDEPAGFDMSASATAIGQQFDTYRNTYQLSPAQMSPLSPESNRNATPSPISLGTNGAYTEQLCTLMQVSTLQAANCQMHEFVFNEQENHGLGYDAGMMNTYNNNTNHAATNHNFCGTIRNNTSGGCFERINNAGTCAPTAHNVQIAESQPQLHNLVSEKERIERIKKDLMQTPITLMQSSPQATVPLQIGGHENANIDFFQ
ncbi:uncharacterized protein LOC128865388 isoform X1 [Anastrepha ludens]|uniref:uncharacterized protein LOC128865388 isoform X1 n=2 Tax=Anastrepha ludens TaxID=28586 RepID=UPI0023AE9327|nr:uncharacterized protein LOC128865388 isoform X1 [Anastrepha ludens]